jgi:hypothetical protein
MSFTSAGGIWVTDGIFWPVVDIEALTDLLNIFIIALHYTNGAGTAYPSGLSEFTSRFIVEFLLLGL